MSVEDNLSDTTFDNEIVEWVEHNKTTFYTRLYKTENQPKAILFIIHGFGEHSDRYQDMARALVQKGIQVFAFDLKGFGKTGRKGGQLGHLGLFANTFQTIDFFINRQKIDNIPNFVYGHSMGGSIVLNFCADKLFSKNIKGVIASAPALALNPKDSYPGIVKKILIGLVYVFPTFPMTISLDDNNLTSNKEELQKYRTSIYNFGKTSLQTASQLLIEGEACRKTKCKEFATPVLVIHAKNDPITISSGSQHFYDNLPANLDKKIVIFESKYHELHFEDEFKDKLVEMYSEWILERI
ncbi:hypothetical protein BB561_003590 [Smittium simulii]|uniref:Serine aminopeptidase S33 domain-containing protein n=1 Tax=Smittium simulii TaxID=133385 RepID=A0A2T9YKJ5_9FUNG|nr:hypothetical protein BB561_003590 [Smittium simulii]